MLLLFIIIYDFDKETEGRYALRHAQKRAARARKAGDNPAMLSKLVDEHHSEFVYRRRKEMVAIRNLKLNLTSGQIFSGKGDALGIV